MYSALGGRALHIQPPPARPPCRWGAGGRAGGRPGGLAVCGVTRHTSQGRRSRRIDPPVPPFLFFRVFRTGSPAASGMDRAHRRRCFLHRRRRTPPPDAADDRRSTLLSLPQLRPPWNQAGPGEFTRGILLSAKFNLREHLPDALGGKCGNLITF